MPELNLQWWSESVDLRKAADSGARLRCCTSAPGITTNIYCEQPYCSRDGNRLALFRRFGPNPTVPGALLVYDIQRYRIAHVLPNVHSVATSAWSGMLYVVAGEKYKRLFCLDLNSMALEERYEWTCDPAGHLHSVSPDYRFGIYHARLDNRAFGIFRIDLDTGEHDLIYESADIANPHLQCAPGGDEILVQENFGWKINEDDPLPLPTESSAIRLFSLTSSGSGRHDFPIGKDGIASTTGHECWAGDSESILSTLVSPYDDGRARGNVVELRKKWPRPRVVFQSELIWNHISASRCGRYFVVDSYDEEEIPLVLGSVRSGKTRTLCDALTSGGGAQYSHAHPYITSDNRWVVFNSDRTGLPQVYLASIPEGFLESLDE